MSRGASLATAHEAADVAHALRKEAADAFRDLRDSTRFWGPADVARAEARWHEAENALDALAARDALEDGEPLGVPA